MIQTEQLIFKVLLPSYFRIFHTSLREANKKRERGCLQNTLVFIVMLALTLVVCVAVDAIAVVVGLLLLFKVVKQFVTRRSTGCILLLQQLQQMFVANVL